MMRRRLVPVREKQNPGFEPGFSEAIGVHPANNLETAICSIFLKKV
jgi:hypothetical protein